MRIMANQFAATLTVSKKLLLCVVAIAVLSLPIFLGIVHGVPAPRSALMHGATFIHLAIFLKIG
jgi:hypothetical protein